MKINYFSRKEQIILSAIDLIDELGINGLSIRELAKKENITEGAIYRHFKSKDDIIIEAIRYYSHFDINIMNTIEKNKFDAKKGINFFINSFSEYYENYPQITAVYCSFESLIYEPNIKKEVQIIFHRSFSFLKNIIEDGKNNGEFPGNIDSEDLADIIIGSFRNIVFKWRVEKYSFPLKAKALDMVNIVLNALSSK